MNEVNINKLIHACNIIFYGDQGSIYDVLKKELNLYKHQYSFEKDFKYIYSKYSNVTNYIFLENFRCTELYKICDNIQNQHDNIYNNNKQIYIIFCNIQFIPHKFYALLKCLIEKSFNFRYIFTCNKKCMYFDSLCFQMFVKTSQCFLDLDRLNFSNLMSNDIKQLENHVFSQNNFNLNSVRQILKKILCNFHDISFILKEILQSFCIKNPSSALQYTTYAANAEHLSRHGNKYLFYLEYFILLVINNDS